ncbi:ABC transporter ATP-binding protein [Aeromicrobium sp. IC_218]|uniref:ABC transporter ATP-binding protein n=1 Tax=Aeromicrobium sp. IC_218 TaxID=2545468 RepID=UPI00103AD40E|nr:ABC transporter ATP-binding protein [Aeromicrobium sp. IC_218]TCJ00714.1 ABC transporter ATP-binding protein [Aeromicrobium sp. IC_218]
MSAVLQVHDLDVHHGQLRAVSGLDLELDAGGKVAVIGANGAGKTTLLRCLAGALPASSGRVLLDGEDVTELPAHRRVRRGVALVPEGRRLFPSLTVEENLLTGRNAGRSGSWDLAAVYELFDWMPERRRQPSGSLSGGQQQAVAIGRALMTNPRVLMLDELSLGLAPVVVRRIYETLPRIVAEGCAVLLVEQDVSQAMAVADHVHCLLEGRTTLAGPPSQLDRAAVEAAYFGLAEA